MKIRPSIRLATLACAVTLAACQKPVAQAPLEPEPEPLATPAPVAVVATPVPDPLAPPGRFYLLQPVSITTQDGIIGLKPGRVLQQTGPGSYAVDGHTVQLRGDQVTNNLRIAGHYARADAAAQVAIRQNLQQSAAQQAAAAAEAQAFEKRAAADGAARQAPKTEKIASGVNRQASGLESSSSLGTSHTKTQGGWLMQKAPDGSWVPVRQLGK